MEFQRNANTINSKHAEFFLPALVLNLTGMILGIFDSVIAGNLLGAISLSAIRLIMPLGLITSALVSMIVMASEIFLSKASGGDDIQNRNRVYSIGLLLSLLVSGTCAAVCLLFKNPVCNFLTQDSELLELIKKYYVWFILDVPAWAMVAYISLCIKLNGFPKFSSGIMSVSIILNIVLDWIFMGPVGMDIKGASLATFCAHAIVLTIALSYYFRKNSIFRFDCAVLGSELQSSSRTAGQMLSTGFSGSFVMTMCMSVSAWYLNTMAQNYGGNSALLAYTIVATADAILFMFVSATIGAMTPMVGTFLGECDFDGIRYVYRRSKIFLVSGALVTVVIVCCFPELLAKAFGIRNQNDLEFTAQMLRICAAGYLFLAYIPLFGSYYATLGRPQFSMVITLMRLVVFTIVPTYILTHLMGLDGFMISIPLSYFLTLVFIIAAVTVIRKKNPGKYRGILLLDDSMTKQVASLSLKATTEQASKVSEFLQNEFEKKEMDKKQSYLIAVAAEEVTVDICSRVEDKITDIDIRIVEIEGHNTLIIRDNGKQFNPLENVSDDLSSIGMLVKICKNVEYFNVLGFNKLKITLD
ncbi:MAG: hypothetical protein MJY71_07700 [Bacteroidaceae bacterium]|nr:hypothetical protein [Bacteroidaceae bacterium]